MSNSIKKNFALNLINTISGLLFPLITFPYTSRILMADGIGQVQFFQSIINYIALFAAIGIPLYAVREVARVRDNKAETTKVTCEILLLHSLLTAGGYLCIFILAATVGKIQADIPLFLLLSTTLFFNAIGVPWFYQGIEDFKYITIRTIAVRIFSLIGLFVFVKTKDDILYYAAITVVANVGSSLFNFFRLRKYLDLSVISSFQQLNLKRHLAPALRIFVLYLITSIYINLDSVMLGFLKDEQAVGYYAAAMRLTRTVLGVATSLSGVLMPRFSNMVSSGLFDEFYALAGKAVSFILALSLPMTVGVAVMASPMISLFCGEGFAPSVLTLQIISPIILFISLASVVGSQILFPLGKEKLHIIATGVGAVMNLTLNLVLIPRYAQYGAAVGTFAAEFTGLLMMILLGRKYLKFSVFTKQNLNYLIGTLLILLYLYVLHAWLKGEIEFLIAGIVGSVFVYGVYLLKMKDPFVMQVMQILTRKITKDE